MPVIVVGGGLSGLSAAHTLLERGATVLVLDKNPFFGGNSTKATSGINGAGTRAQSELKIPDTAEAFYHDTQKSARELARPDLIKVLTYNSAAAVNWLSDKFGLDLSKVSRLGGHSFERTHRGSAQFPGMTITYAEMEALEDFAKAEPEQITIYKKATATKLIKENGAVVGVEYTYKGQSHKAYGPVVIATGGYAADFTDTSLLKKYRPDLVHLPTTNGDHCTGDGQKMILDIGGNGIDLEKVQVHPTGLVDPKDPDAKVKFLAAEALRGVGGLLLDNEGDRFCDELGHRDYVTGRMWENNKFPVRLILNAGATKEIEWHCKHYVGRGLMKKFANGHDLAKEMGIPASKLEKTFNDYMDVCKNPKTDPFGKKFFHNVNWSMDAGPFHVALMTPVLHYTMGGVEIDAESRVLDTAGTPIPGLFASGEVAGGVHGANRLGGSSLLGCVVFGRVAGDSAARYLLQQLSKGGGSGPVPRLSQIGSHLNVKVVPGANTVEISWGQQDSTATTASAAAPAQLPKEEPKQEQKKELKEYTLDDVAKHNTEDDCWVVVNGQVLDATSFLGDHPGGKKAIMLFAGKDATEEFNMLHEKSVVQKYAPEIIIGTLRK